MVPYFLSHMIINTTYSERVDEHVPAILVLALSLSAVTECICFFYGATQYIYRVTSFLMS